MSIINAQFMGMARHLNTGNGMAAILDHDNVMRFADLAENAQVFETAGEAVTATQAVVNKLPFRDDIIVFAVAIPPVA